MREIAATGNPAVQFFLRDADNVDTAQALVLIGAKPARAGLTVCGFCGFDSCASADASGARCAFNMIDLGIAVGSAVSWPRTTVWTAACSTPPARPHS